MFPQKRFLLTTYNLKLATNTGFTVIELMVVIAVTVILLSVTLSFSRNSNQGIILRNERARLIAAITRAKASSIQTLGVTGQACGYGIWFDPTPGIPGFIFFRDTPVFPETECIRNGNVYTGDMILGPGEEISRGEFDDGVIYKDLPVTEVLFIPPDPKTVIMPSLAEEAIIILSTADGGAETKIQVTSAGLITAL